ncbi:MAG: hypothetical protein P8Z37_19980, partial [Acidobacteriota bacterium]
TLVHIPGGTSDLAVRSLVWVGRDGSEEPIDTPHQYYQNLKISPDGTRVALTVFESDIPDIRILDLDRKTWVKIADSAMYPLWTSDSKNIVFYMFSVDNGGIFKKTANNTGKAELLYPSPNVLLRPSSWYRDEKDLLLTSGRENIFDIGMLSMDGEPRYELLLNEEKMTEEPKISLSGNWMAYMSGESGHANIFVRPFPDVDKDKHPVSINGGAYPIWSPDDSELYYRKDDQVIAVTVKTEPKLSLGHPELLSKDTSLSSTGSKN